MMKPVIVSALPVVAMLLALSGGVAQAADGAELYKTKTCFTCHGQDGKTPIMPGYPKIAGQDPGAEPRVPFVTSSLRPVGGPITAVTDYMKAVPDQVAHQLQIV